MALNHLVIQLSGTPFERGVQYGTVAKTQIEHSIETYRTLFAEHASLSWQGAVAAAHAFEPEIAAYLPDALEEMKGIAQGCGLSYDDILTLNCRSEIMFARPDGCSVVAVLPESSVDGHTYLGQTWDWIMPARASTVVLEVDQSPLPKILMVAEAGMVGGKGLNSAGIGVTLNALSVGHGRVGVPLHVMYRAILNSTLISDAMDKVFQCKRAGAGNFTIASAEGLAFCVEYSPENFDALSSAGEPICHTNHYLSPLFIEHDQLKTQLSDSYVRLNRLIRRTKPLAGKLDAQRLLEVFSDHANCPDSVCSHEDMHDAPARRFCTIYAVVMDLNERAMWVTNGYPCEEPAYRLQLI